MAQTAIETGPPRSEPDGWTAREQCGLCNVAGLLDIGMAVLAPDGRVAMLNEQGRRILHDGAPTASALTVDMLAVVARHPGVRGDIVDMMTRAMTGATVRRDISARGPGEAPLHLDMVAAPIFGPPGQVHRIMIACRDITAQTLAEQELRQKALRHQIARQGAAQVLWEWTLATGRYVINEDEGMPHDLSIYHNAQTVEDIARLIPEEDRPHVDAAMVDLIENDVPCMIEHRIMAPDGTTAWVAVGAAAERDETGKAVRVIGYTKDITQRKRDELELIEAKSAAQAASKAKSEFLAIMSHEIRTPMNGVMGMAQVLADTSLNDDQRQFVDIILTSSQALLTIINDILDLSKLEADSMPVAHEPIDLADMIRQIENLFAHQAAKKGIAFITAIDPGVPHQVVGDALRLRQILINLVGNAVKFTDDGSVRLTVAPLDGPDADGKIHLRFCVADTGIGIDEEAAEHLFDAFAQADTSTTREYGGTGLGLTICDRLAALLGGTIDFTSTQGEGSTFMADIPFTTADDLAEDDSDEDPDRAAAGLADVETGGRVLVVEDNEVNQFLFRTVLERAGYQVVAANNGQEALDCLDRETVDLILLDIQMPVLDGIETTKRIRQRTDEIGTLPIVALTANAMTGDRERYLAAGMDDYIAKPIEPAAFLGTVADWIRRPAAVSAAP